MSYLKCVASPPNQFSSLGFLPKLDSGEGCLLKSRKLVVNSLGRKNTTSVNFDIRMSKNCYHAVPPPDAPIVVEKHVHEDGIGIVKFLHGKNFFITGATGFLGKVLVEKLLRSTPDIGKIYLMINAKDKKVAAERLKKEIIGSEIFKDIKKRFGDSYEGFMLSKLIPVKGNVGESDLNLEKHDAQMVTREVHFIISSAATTSFDGRYDESMKINTEGPCHLLALGQKCDKLEVFLHISTAYANEERKGTVSEKLFAMGDTIARENFTSESTLPLPPLLDVEAELSLLLNTNFETSGTDSSQQYMKNLGLQRARKYGWQDTYVFTKAMGEMMVDHKRGDIPVVILRPSIIESTYRDPFPGWIEGNRMMDPVITLVGKGMISGFLGQPTCPLDVVPADMVVNATIATLAKHGMANKSDINVYQVASSVVNPMHLCDLGDAVFNHFSSNPYINTNGKPVHVSPWKYFNSKEDFISCIGGHLGNTSASAGFARLHRRIIDQVEHLAQIYKPYTSGEIGRFDMKNTLGLLESMSEDEKDMFGFNVKEIDWKDYLENIHIPGLRRHVMKSRGIGSQ